MISPQFIQTSGASNLWVVNYIILLVYRSTFDYLKRAGDHKLTTFTLLQQRHTTKLSGFRVGNGPPVFCPRTRNVQKK